MMVCIQCSMRALVKGETPPTFDETAIEHLLRVHPDPDATRAERQELMRQLTEKLRGENHGPD